MGSFIFRCLKHGENQDLIFFNFVVVPATYIYSTNISFNLFRTKDQDGEAKFVTAIIPLPKINMSQSKKVKSLLRQIDEIFNERRNSESQSHDIQMLEEFVRSLQGEASPVFIFLFFSYHSNSVTKAR